MVERARILSILAVAIATGCEDDCGDDSRPNRAPGDGSAIQSAAATSGETTGQGGRPSDVTSQAGVTAGGTGGGGGQGGCGDQPSPDRCAEIEAPSVCDAVGCSHEFFDEIVVDPERGCERVVDIPGCLPVSVCGECEIPEVTRYWRGDRVIEWDRGCLVGWTSCTGADAEPPGCECPFTEERAAPARPNEARSNDDP